MSALNDMTLSAMRKGLTDKAFSVSELIDDHLKAITAAAPLNAVVTDTADHARAAAKASEVRYANGTDRPLEGIPILVKDLYCTKGVRTTAASKILQTFVPPYESHVTQNLWQAGAILIGKTNLDEFAMGSSNEHSIFGAAINPWRSSEEPATPLVPGGSSGGSAAAVAARLAPLALGTDTGGSIRQPASLCGIVGVKPTYGRCSRWGIIAFASSLDQAGPFTRSVEDAAMALTAMAGFDPKDSTSADRPVPAWEEELSKDIKGLRVGLMDGLPADTPPKITALQDQGVTWLREAGAEIVPITLPTWSMGLPAYYVLAPAEASSNLARYDGMRYGTRVAAQDLTTTYARTRSQGFGAEVKRRIMVGTYVLSAGYYEAYYARAQRVRALIAREFTAAFESCDVILMPTTPRTAFGVGSMLDPIDMYLNDLFTVPASLAGLPALSVPVGQDHVGLPMGLQLMAPPFQEGVMLRCAAALERAAGFAKTPEVWW
ncbi:MAG: Asp-tRNA(Asn)/Glu-tRNA(Gln) amidotransferase subunit GatA [Pseudomonadota bacterium]